MFQKLETCATNAHQSEEAGKEDTQKYEKLFHFILQGWNHIVFHYIKQRWHF